MTSLLRVEDHIPRHFHNHSYQKATKENTSTYLQSESRMVQYPVSMSYYLNCRKLRAKTNLSSSNCTELPAKFIKD